MKGNEKIYNQIKIKFKSSCCLEKKNLLGNLNELVQYPNLFDSNISLVQNQ